VGNDLRKKTGAWDYRSKAFGDRRRGESCRRREGAERKGEGGLKIIKG